MSHGRKRYDAGCRCLVCTAANTAHAAAQRARRLARLLASPVPESDPLHGTATGYNAGCRCEACGGWRALRYAREEGHRPHRWRQAVTEAYWLARYSWEALCEEVAIGYDSEIADFRRDHPPPTLASVLRAMSPQSAV